MIEQAGLSEDVELRVEAGQIVIAAPRVARAGWAEAAQRARAAGDDALESSGPTRFDDGVGMAVKVVALPPTRGDVFLVEFDPTRGSDIRKTRPCVVISPDELNHHLRTTIVAPLTTGGHSYPYRVACRFAGKSGHIVLDQVRTVDRERLRKRLGVIAPGTLQSVLHVLVEMFEP